jgi:hypothetical protein
MYLSLLSVANGVFNLTLNRTSSWSFYTSNFVIGSQNHLIVLYPDIYTSYTAIRTSCKSCYQTKDSVYYKSTTPSDTKVLILARGCDASNNITLEGRWGTDRVSQVGNPYNELTGAQIFVVEG